MTAPGVRAVAADRAVMLTVQPHDLGRHVRVTASLFAPEVECRCRYRATCEFACQELLDAASLLRVVLVDEIAFVGLVPHDLPLPVH